MGTAGFCGRCSSGTDHLIVGEGHRLASSQNAVSPSELSKARLFAEAIANTSRDLEIFEARGGKLNTKHKASLDGQDTFMASSRMTIRRRHCSEKLRARVAGSRVSCRWMD